MNPKVSFAVEQNVGRLVEARVFQLATAEAVERYRRAFAPYTRGRPLPVLVADHRPARVYSPEVAEKLVSIFADLNRVWTRAALLVSPSNATLSIQLQRIVRESQNQWRRVFLEPAACTTFLGEVLDDAERDRLRAFLTEAVRAPPVAQ